MTQQIRIQFSRRIWVGVVFMLLLVACLPADEKEAPSALSAATSFPATATRQSTKVLMPTRTPRPTSTPISPTRTPRPTSTQIPPTRTPRPTRTPVPPTRTTTPVEPSATPTITPTFTPLVTSNPSDEEVVRLLFHGRELPLGTYKEGIQQQVAAGKISDEFTRQDVDLNGDGQPEILFYGPITSLYVYFAILGRANGVWQPWLYTENGSPRCAEVRATVEQQRVLVDFLDCGPSATDQFYLTWQQRWIQCGENTCTVIWSARLLWMGQFNSGRTNTLQYEVGELMTPDSNTIQLTTRRFGLIDVPSEWAPPDTPVDAARRVVGPDTVEVFQWDGTTYQLKDSTQIAPKIEISGEFDLESQKTERLVNSILHDQHSGEEFAAARATFWGYPSPKAAENQRWGRVYRSPDAAAHNGPPRELGGWVAGIIGANDQPLCRLTIQQYNGQEFSLFSRREVPCTVNFTRLAWADITGDRQDELLLLTISPDSASVQRLHIYAVEGELVELATVYGDLNGPDGVNIRWEDYDHDGTIDEILAGLPLTSFQTHTFAEFTPHPRWRVYRWDTAQQTLIAGEIRP